jgi:hypothetical protein
MQNFLNKKLLIDKNVNYICVMGKLITIQVTQTEIQEAMKRNIHRSKKTYTRKSKHKKYD